MSAIAKSPRARKPLLLAALAAAALAAAPAAAEATLVFSRTPMNPAVFVAEDDGSGARKLGKGFAPKVTPDGETVLFFRTAKNGSLDAMVAPAAGGPVRKLLGGIRNTAVFAASPDSTKVLLTVGPEVGRQKLLVVDLASGARRQIAAGYFSSASFSPQSDRLVFGRSASESYPPRTDVYVAALSGGKPRRITTDRRSQYPLWGPSGQIVFVKLLGAEQRRYGPKNELFLMNDEGGQVKRLTRTKVGALVQGLVPTDWVGDNLLAEFVGQDTSYAVAVDARTGRERPLSRDPETGFVGAALSADGTTVLGSVGGWEPGPGHKVVTMPFGGGRQKLLVDNAFEPDWSR